MNGFGSPHLPVGQRGRREVLGQVPLQDRPGHRALTQAEADRIAGEDADFHRRDLWTRSSAGDHPSWTLYVQVMPFAEAADYRFNPFDLTKVWPHGDYPLIKVGRLGLDRNPENYFAQIEQAAFEPANLVPGIGVSPDKMLLGRLFAYPDTHRYRIGANYLQLPVNRPKAPVHTYNRDGAMRTTTRASRSTRRTRTGGPGPTRASGARTGRSRRARSSAQRVRAHGEDDDFGQPGRMVHEVLDGRAGAGAAGVQRRRPRLGRGDRARVQARVSTTGGTSTRRSAPSRQGAGQRFLTSSYLPATGKSVARGTSSPAYRPGSVSPGSIICRPSDHSPRGDQPGRCVTAGGRFLRDRPLGVLRSTLRMRQGRLARG